MKKVFVCLLTALLLPSLAGCTAQPAVQNRLHGTYRAFGGFVTNADGEVTQNRPDVILTLDAASGVFTYADVLEECYISGTFSAQEDGGYRFLCDNEEDRAILPDQVVYLNPMEDQLLQGTVFENRVIPLECGGSTRVFHKSEEQIVNVRATVED